ncbi:hypothetical protein HX773_24655 [Pantoea sp. B9002]|uniref:hypothetical protein n=1 Tax=Pantoea sp. B9002 TaxID=2726979 RepID=UPI0015A0E150|nr:hypothetical protein [Pantoea sp. B9002]NWA64093.1 hypothetical protein [Pantoea sp. B9002]
MQDGVAVIRVNNIEVGSMPISQYEEIVKSVKKDWRTRVAAVFSYVGFVWKFIIRLWSYFVQCFSVLFALFMLYSLFHPAEITQFIDEMRSLPSENIANGIRSLTNICILVTIMSYAISFLLKGSPVFVSASENAINKKIREVMEVPAEGQVSITFKRDGLNSVR